MRTRSPAKFGGLVQQDRIYTWRVSVGRTDSCAWKRVCQSQNNIIITRKRRIKLFSRYYQTAMSILAHYLRLPQVDFDALSPRVRRRFAFYHGLITTNQFAWRRPSDRILFPKIKSCQFWPTVQPEITSTCNSRHLRPNESITAFIPREGQSRDNIQ